MTKLLVVLTILAQTAYIVGQNATIEHLKISVQEGKSLQYELNWCKMMYRK